MPKKYYAHSLEGKSPSEWQPLEEHLKNVAEMARDHLLNPLTLVIGDIWRDCDTIMGKYFEIIKPYKYHEK